MSGLQVEHITRQDGKTFVYRLRGVLGESTYSFDFLEELRRQVKDGPERIVLNLADLEYITSSGVGIVAAAYTSAQRAGKSFCLVDVPSQGAARPRHLRRLRRGRPTTTRRTRPPPPRSARPGSSGLRSVCDERGHEDGQRAQPGPRPRHLAVHEPGPERVEDGLEEEQQGALERRYAPDAARHEDVGEADLDHAQVADPEPVRRSPRPRPAGRAAGRPGTRGGCPATAAPAAAPAGEPPSRPSVRASQRSPATVSAQVSPETAASTLPSAGSGAVALGSLAAAEEEREPERHGGEERAAPAAGCAPSAAAARSAAGRAGAVDCRKIALDAVVSLLEST